MLVTFRSRFSNRLIVGILTGSIDDEGSTWLWVRSLSSDATLYLVQIEQLV